MIQDSRNQTGLDNAIGKRMRELVLRMKTIGLKYMVRLHLQVNQSDLRTVLKHYIAGMKFMLIGLVSQKAGKSKLFLRYYRAQADGRIFA